ncbi:MAG: dienelactone hydrolase family protein [Bacteroidales bacterium]|nr:dienelactone hydrolase family protein [Bacteroidales bacterium]MCF8405354.1 dienelactone hydrolase family protein [Bacteroidales bacterium]
MKKIKQSGILILLLIFSIALLGSNKSDDNTINSNGIVLHTNIPIVAQTLSLDMPLSMDNTSFTGISGDTFLVEAAEDEELYGYKAMEYSNSKYNSKLPYRLFVPENYRKGEKYPLVIFLHGGGKKGSDNVSQIRNMAGPLAFVNPAVQNKYPSFVLAPQCAKSENWRGTSYSGERLVKSLEDIKPSSVYLMLMELLESLQDDYGIDSDRIYLTGQSMGGAGTWFICLSNPDKFAAIAPICGWSLPSEASAIVDVPVWAFHGAEDKTIPPEGSISMIEALEKAGSTEVKYTEYPNVGHESWEIAYREDTDNNGIVDLIEWMFSLKRK